MTTHVDPVRLTLLFLPLLLSSIRRNRLPRYEALLPSLNVPSLTVKNH